MSIALQRCKKSFFWKEQKSIRYQIAPDKIIINIPQLFLDAVVRHCIWTLNLWMIRHHLDMLGLAYCILHIAYWILNIAFCILHIDIEWSDITLICWVLHIALPSGVWSRCLTLFRMKLQIMLISIKSLPGWRNAWGATARDNQGQFQLRNKIINKRY